MNLDRTSREQFLVIKPVRRSVRELELPLVLVGVRLCGSFHFHVESIQGLLAVRPGKKAGYDHNEERDQDLERQPQSLDRLPRKPLEIHSDGSIKKEVEIEESLASKARLRTIAPRDNPGS